MPNDEAGQSQTPGTQTATETTTTQAPDIAGIVNAAVTNHLKRLDLNKTIESRVAELLKAQTPVQAVVDDDGGKKGKQSPEMTAMMTKLADLEKATRSQTERAEAAEKKQRDDRAYNDLRANLATSGVRPDMQEIAASYLFKAQNRIEFDSNGTPLFRVKQAGQYGMPEEEVLMPLADGVAAYVRSKEAAAFMPAPGTSQAAPVARQAARIETPNTGNKLTTDGDKIAAAMAAAKAIRAAQQAR
jgi:hypothetical protein